VFTPADHAALSGTWSWLLDVVNPAVAAGPSGLIDDLAYVTPWGFDPAQWPRRSSCLLHGGQDRMVLSSHSAWLARRCPGAELRLCPEDGHVSVPNSSAAVLSWLREHADGG
jgi:hypothetical protein